jgi:hypothetical protein
MTADVEEQRHRTEVRMCLRMGREKFEAYVKGMKKERAQRLWRDVKQQHQLGNEGAAGDWREPEEGKQ